MEHITNLENLNLLENDEVPDNVGPSTSQSLSPTNGSSCQLCPIVSAHKAQVQAILAQAGTNRPPVSGSFRTTPICSVQTGGGGDVDLTIADIETRYKEDYPDWDRKGTCFPPGPLYFDKLEKTEPWTRACDLEKRLEDARQKVAELHTLPYEADDMDADIIEKCSTKIMETMIAVVTNLSITNNRQIDGVKNMIKGLARGKLEQLKGSDALQALQDLQDKAFEEIKTKSRAWQNYSER